MLTKSYYRCWQIFEKALDEPKYCSMYAQLCKKLSEEAPNFDPPDGPCTFNRHLLTKCQVRVTFTVAYLVDCRVAYIDGKVF